MMKISVVAAIGQNNELGYQGKLVWRIKEDLRQFKKITMGHHILMGRKTFESIGKVLPGRTTIVLSRRRGDYYPEGVLVVKTLAEGIKLALSQGENELMVVGGGSVYADVMPMVDKLYLTRVEATAPADTYFPYYRENHFDILDYTYFDGTPSYSFEVWHRISAEREDA